MDRIQIKKLIREFRERHALSVQAIADRAGVTRAAWYAWENLDKNSRVPSDLASLQGLAQVLYLDEMIELLLALEVLLDTDPVPDTDSPTPESV